MRRLILVNNNMRALGGVAHIRRHGCSRLSGIWNSFWASDQAREGNVTADTAKASSCISEITLSESTPLNEPYVSKIESESRCIQHAPLKSRPGFES